MIGGVFQCWFWGSQNCPNAEKVRPAGISPEEAKKYEIREIYYEHSGFAIFEKENDKFQIRKLSGEKSEFSLFDLNRQTEEAIGKQAIGKGENIADIKQSLWKYVPLEKILSEGMISHENNILPLLRKDDLKSHVDIYKDKLEEAKKSQVNSWLKENKLSIPIGYIATSTPCQFIKVDSKTETGSCKPFPKAPAFLEPDVKSQKIMDVSFTFAHLEGMTTLSPKMESNQREKPFVYEEWGDWILLKLMVLDRQNRNIWINKKNIPFQIITIDQTEGTKLLIEYLKSQDSSNIADDLQSVLKTPPDLDLDSAGETKWSEGVLWVKVKVNSQPHCSVEIGSVEPLAIGWVPYIDPLSKKKVLSWYSRGC